MFQGEVRLYKLPEEKILESNTKTLIEWHALPLVKKVINLTDGAGIATLQDNGLQEFDFPLNETIPYDIDREHAKTVIGKDIFDFYAPITNADVMAIDFLILRNPYTQSLHTGNGSINLLHSDVGNSNVPSHTDEFYTDRNFYFWTRPGIKLDINKLKYAHYEIWKFWKNLDTRTDSVWKLVLLDKQTPVIEKYIQPSGVPADTNNQRLKNNKDWTYKIYTLYDHPEIDNYRYYFFPNTDKDKAIVWKSYDSVTPCYPVFHAGAYIYGEQNPVRHTIDASIHCWKL